MTDRLIVRRGYFKIISAVNKYLLKGVKTTHLESDH